MNIINVTNAELKKVYQWFFGAKVEYGAVLTDVIEDGTITNRFAFFSITACAIATLGLLLNSPAVIIGAMLISPLMGPIVMQGFSLSMIDVSMFRKSTLTIFAGAGLAVFVSFVIARLSPITEVNSEILARTSPNLFDLLIAVFSGLAAGYTFIKRKGSAIVGVAIATSLMPPLAVTGYGLATENWWISEGAFFLFMTNLLAICLSVSIVSKLYGFGARKESRYLLGQTLIALSILAVLAIPLAISLKNIAFQAYAVSVAKSTIKNHFTDKLSRLNDFSIAIEKNKIDIDAVVITKKYDSKAQDKLKKELEESLMMPVGLSLVQIALTNNRQIEELRDVVRAKNILTTPAATLPEQISVVEDIKSRVSQSLWFSYKLIQFDEESKKIHIFVNHDPQISLRSLRNSEASLAKRFSEWSVLIYPAPQQLPSIYYEHYQTHLNENNSILLQDIMWVLNRWDSKEIDVIGYASTSGREAANNKISHLRAENVAQVLKANGFTVHVKGRFQVQDQKKKERYKGYGSYQRVDIRPHYDTTLKNNNNHSKSMQIMHQ